MTPQEVAQAALATARARGTEVVVVVEELSAASVRWARNAVTAAGIADDRRVTVIALGGDRAPGVVTARGVGVRTERPVDQG